MPTASPHCTFSTGEPNLSELLEHAATGKVQLPDFQRGWVWDDNHIRSLLASVSLSYPIVKWSVFSFFPQKQSFHMRRRLKHRHVGRIKPARILFDRSAPEDN